MKQKFLAKMLVIGGGVLVLGGILVVAFGHEAARVTTLPAEEVMNEEELAAQEREATPGASPEESGASEEKNEREEKATEGEEGRQEEAEREKPSLALGMPQVPFASQAPLGNWENPFFQNGCEEASILMASRVGQAEPLGKEEATEEILALASLSEKLFGTAVDTSAADTLALFRAYTGKKDGVLLEEVMGETLRASLARGEILIIPMNGQLLGNPHFTSPGPERHMLVLLGYDETTKEYITHDPGTRLGALYRYPEERFEGAMRDYPTGDHRPIAAVEKRAIAVPR
jgi:hypothetical protein